AAGGGDVCARPGMTGRARNAAARAVARMRRRPIAHASDGPGPIPRRTPKAVPEPVLRVGREGARARVTLARPAVRNAFNAELIAQLRDTFLGFADDPSIRVVILEGEGKSFCGGADVNWMRGSLALSEAENVRDAEAMSDMYRAIDGCPKPVIARVHGAALGGGAGLCAVADAVVAEVETIFGFTETKLGIIPGVISPFVLAKIGASHARRLFLTGERFDAQRAQAIGLVHEVVGEDALDGTVAAIADEVETAGPSAIAAVKALIRAVTAASYDESRSITARAIAKQRTSDEGQEGLRAFLERRRASWAGR
ncbi:MAG: Enoyl-CoA hydratase/isomerase, partial [Candidatus Eremiobacteraeota bacterium]|nr:Enoyl-CoA hydratase/isomerase [Candidatus Eremiobacteraeota bacterium]